MRVDPITLEVVRGYLDTTVEEMQFSLVRSAYSSLVQETEDVSSSLLDINAQKLAQATAVTLHQGIIGSAVEQLLASFPPATMRRGDLYALNDPYEGGTHLPDIIVAMPVFVQDRPVALACTILHHEDIGGKIPGSLPTDATEIFQEGLRIPALKLYDAGKPNETLFRILERNSRFPGDLLGDLEAQASACQVGARRLEKLIAEYGVDQILRYWAELLDRSEQLTRAKLAEIPDGCYDFVDYLDNDGVDLERRVPVHVSVQVEGSDLVIDFAGTSDQVRGPVNATPPTVRAAATFVVRAITDPSIPANAGCDRPVQLHLPAGSLVNPRPPAAVNARILTFQIICDALFGAFAQAIPARIPAAAADSFFTTFLGVDPASGGSYSVFEIGSGGLGARPTADGIDVFRSKVGNCLNPPVEALEMHSPLRVHRYTLRNDSGGPGRFRGGLGYEKVFELLRGEATISHRGERYYTSPWGLASGGAGASSESVVVRRDRSREVIPSKRVLTLRAGDEFHTFSSGGGGFGDPYERPVELVHADVFDRKVSIHAALEQYGVVIDEDTMAVDPIRTADLRR